MLEAAVADLDSLPYDVVWIFAVASYADVAIELRAEAPARLLLDLLMAFDDQVLFIGATAGSPVAYYCGGLESVLGRYDEAETHFAKAAELNASGQMEFAAAVTFLQWGRMLSARGGPGDARTSPRPPGPSPRHSREPRVRQRRPASRRGVVGGILRLGFGNSDVVREHRFRQ